MLRSEIPSGLLVRRQADINRIPSRVLTAIKTTDELARRLLAADEFRQRARVPHLDPDLYRHRIGQASEVLTTADPKRAAALVKAAGVTASPEQEAAGVPGWVHRPFTGTHTHAHAAWDGPDSNGDGGHQHTHSHRGDSNHHHSHANVSAKSARPVQPGSLAKAAVGDTIEYPAVNLLERKANAASSASTALIEMAREGRLAALEADIGRMHRDVSSGRVELVKNRLPRPAAGSAGDLLNKAGRYERQAAVMSSGEDRSAYLELARREREKAGAL